MNLNFLMVLIEFLTFKITLNLSFDYFYYMEYQKIANLIGTTLNEVPRFMTKNWIKFMISQVVLKTDTNQTKK